MQVHSNFVLLSDQSNTNNRYVIQIKSDNMQKFEID